MRKNVLITLITATATGTAFANVNLDGQVGEWSFTGVPGEGATIGTLNLLVPNLAGGEASQTIANLPQGKYILSWDSATAVNVLVKANGDEVTNGAAFDFAGGDLTITIGPAENDVNSGGYTIEAISLQIDCNPEAFRDTLLAAIATAKTSFHALSANVDDDTVEAFDARKEALITRLETLEAKVALIPNDDDVTLDAYKEYELWDLTEENPLYTGDAGFDAIEDDITTYNGDADLVSAKADYVKKATDAAVAAGTNVEAVDYDAVVDLYATIDDNAQAEWIHGEVDADYNALGATKATLEAEIAALKEQNCDDMTTLEAVQDADAELDTQIADLNAAVTAYAADATAVEAAINNAIKLADNYNKIYLADGDADNPSVIYFNDQIAEARKALFKLGGVFVPIQQQANEKIDDILTATLEALLIKEGQPGTGSDSNYTHDSDLLKAALADIETVVNDALATMTGPYAVVADKIQALVDDIDNTDGIRQTDAADLEAEKAIIDGKIAEVEEAAAAKLADGTITDTSLDTEIAAIQTLINTYNGHIADSRQDVANWQANNDLLDGYLNGDPNGLVTVWNGWITTEETEIGEHTDWWITENAQFKASYNDVKDYIQEQIDKNNDTFYNTKDDIAVLTTADGVVETIKASVEGFTATGDLIINEILAVASKVTTYTGYVNEIKAVLDGKTAYVANAKTPFSNQLTTIQATIDQMAAALSNAVATQNTGQKIYEEVQAVSTAYGSIDFNGKLNTVLSELEKQITAQNQSYVYNALTAANDALPAGTAIPGKDNMVTIISDFQTEVNGVIIPTADATIAADEDITTYAGTFAEADDAIKAVYDYLESVNAAVAACNENVDNHAANAADIADLQDTLDDLDTKAQGYEAYTDAYKALIEAEQDNINELTASNDADYNEFDITKEVDEDGVATIIAGTPVALGLDKAITLEEESIDATDKKIEQNEADYQHFVDLSVDLALKLTGYVDVIEAHIEAGSLDRPELAEEMNGILTDLYGYNGTLYEAYTKMFAEEGYTYAEVEAKITDWEDQANLIMASLNSEVMEYNNGILGIWENNTIDGYKGAYNTYLATVRDFDEYKEISNEGFLAFTYGGKTVAELLEETHGGLFEYYDLIRQLNNDAVALVNKLNGTYNEEADGDDYTKVGVTITDQFDPGTTVETVDGHTVSGFYTLSAQYKAEIEKVLTDFATQINGAAEAYYAQIQPEKDNLLTTAVADMTAAGIEEADANTALTTLKGYYNNAIDTYATVALNADPLAKSMDDICGDLDKITAASVLAATEGAAITNWNAAYEAAVEEATVDFTACPGIDTTSYDALFDELAPIDEEAQEDYSDQTLLANLVDLKTRLENAANAAKAEGEALIAAWNTEHNNQLLYDNFMGAGMESLNDMYDALSEYVLQLACAPDEIAELNAIKGMIDDLKADVEAGGVAGVTTVLGVADNYEESSRYENIVAVIDAEYVQAYNNEIDFLQSNVDAVRAGFNSALADDKLPEGTDVDKLWDDIDALRDAINALPDATTAEEAQEGIEGVTELQDQLAGYQVELDGYLGNNTIGEVVEALTDTYNGVNDKLSELQLTLDDCLESVQEEYAEQVAELEAKLEAVNAKINTDDPAIIYQQANYEDQLSRIEAEIEALTTAVENAESAAQAQKALEAQNQDIYETLTDEVSEIGVVRELVEEEQGVFGYSAQSTIDDAQWFEEYMQEWLDTEYEAVRLPGDDTAWITSYCEVLCNNLNYVRTYKAYNTTRSYYNSASNKVAQVADYVLAYDNNHPSQAGRFEGELANLVSAFAALNQPVAYSGDTNPYVTADVTAYVDGLKNTYEQSVNIYDEATKLIAYINKHDVVMGDATGDNNVNIADVTKLLNWILNNTPYDDTDKKHIAADINGNHRLDTSDIQSIMNIIFGSPTQAMAMQRMAPKPANIAVTAERMAVANDAQRFAVSMTNDTQLVGGMVDIVLPAGMEITSIMPTERLEGLDFYTNDLGNGVTRVVFISTTETHNISGAEGALFNIEVTGTGSISLDNVEFTNSKAHLYTIGAVTSPSGIESIWNDVKAFGRRIYNVSGQMVNRLQRGINIITNSDGTSSKVLKK